MMQAHNMIYVYNILIEYLALWQTYYKIMIVYM